MKVDFHTHTHYSPDSPIKPAQLAQRAKELGIVPAITDHYTMGAIPEMEKLGIGFIPGEELSVITPHGKADMIGLFMNEELQKNIDFYEAIDLLKGQGAIIYAPHPFDPFRVALNDEKLLKEAQVIEVFNAHSSDHFDSKAREFAGREGKLMAAGSDAHFLFEFGGTYVEMELDELEPKKLLKALKNGKIVGKRTHKLRRFAHRVGSTLLKPLI